MLSNTSSLEAEKETCGDKFLSLSCLTALLRRLTGQVSRCCVPAPSYTPAQADRRLVSRLWEVARKLPAVAVVAPAGLVWTPEQFVRQHLGQVGLVMRMRVMIMMIMMMMIMR